MKCIWEMLNHEKVKQRKKNEVTNEGNVQITENGDIENK